MPPSLSQSHGKSWNSLSLQLQGRAALFLGSFPVIISAFPALPNPAHAAPKPPEVQEKTQKNQKKREPGEGKENIPRKRRIPAAPVAFPEGGLGPGAARAGLAPPGELEWDPSFWDPKSHPLPWAAMENLPPGPPRSILGRFQGWNIHVPSSPSLGRAGRGTGSKEPTLTPLGRSRIPERKNKTGFGAIPASSS